MANPPHRARIVLFCAVSALIAVLVGCPKPTPPLKPAPKLELLVSGCGFDSEANVCHATSATISVWAAPVEAGPELSVETEGLVLHRTTPLDRGTRYTLTQTSTAQTGRFTVQARLPGHEVGSETVEIRPSCKTGGCWPAEAMALAEKASKLTRAGKYEEAVEAATKAAEMFREVGARSEAIRLECLAVFCTLKRGQVAEAASMVNAIPAPHPWGAENKHFSSYVSALYLRDSARPLEALDTIQQSEILNRRVGNNKHLRTSLQVRLPIEATHAAKPNFSEAYAELTRQGSEIDDCSGEAYLLTNLAWSLLIFFDRPSGDCSSEPDPGIDDILTIAARATSMSARCAPEILQTARLNEAQALLASNQPQEAMAELDRLEAHLLGRLERQTLQILKGRTLLALNKPREALSTLRSELYESSLDFELRGWRAVAQIETGHLVNGLRSLSILDRDLAKVESILSLLPNGHSATRARDLVTLWTTEAHMRLGSLESAFQAAAKSIVPAGVVSSRYVDDPVPRDRLHRLTSYYLLRRQKEELEESLWTVSGSPRKLLKSRIEMISRKMADLLTSRRDDTTTVNVHEPEPEPLERNHTHVLVTRSPGPGAGWRILFRTEGRIEHIETTENKIVDGVASLLDTDAAPDATMTVTLHPCLSGKVLEKTRLSNHEMLIDRYQLTYGGSSAPASKPVVPSKALVLVGEGDDIFANEEASEVADGLSRAGFDVGVQLGIHIDSIERALELIESADYFHFVGHSSSDAGPFDSHLLLRRGLKITLVDLLTLDRSPSWVVLSSCESGRSANRAIQLGLANAFLQRGALEVIASTREVRGRTAARIGSKLGVPGRTLSQNLRLAQLDIRAQDPQADWSAFRAFVRP